MCGCCPREKRRWLWDLIYQSVYSKHWPLSWIRPKQQQLLRIVTYFIKTRFYKKVYYLMWIFNETHTYFCKAPKNLNLKSEEMQIEGFERRNSSIYFIVRFNIMIYNSNMFQVNLVVFVMLLRVVFGKIATKYGQNKIIAAR